LSENNNNKNSKEQKKKKEKEKKEKNYGPKEPEHKSPAKQQFISKYYARAVDVLYEAVIVGGRPYFVNLEWDFRTGQPFCRLIDKIPLPELSDRPPTIELLPPTREQYLSKPYEFKSEAELNSCLQLAVKETPDTLYRRQRLLARNYIDANDTHLTMLAADAVFTYFQDRLGQTHYVMFVGDNDTGKTANLVFLQHQGYRPMLDVDITAANIYGFLGNFEEGQGIILEDEADDIEKDGDKMKIYKSGYNSGKTVTRTDYSGFGRKIQGWKTFSFKAFTAEQAPDHNKAKGFLDRTFIFHCTSGRPPYDIQEITDPAGDEEHTELLNQLIQNRKVLFCYRLLHYQDRIPNVQLSVINREKQLCKPLLRLFQQAKCQDAIGVALADMIGQKRGLKRGTLESKILAVVSEIISNKEKQEAQRNIIDNNKDANWTFRPWFPNEIPMFELFETVRVSLEGEYRREKDKSFETDEHGIVSHDKIRRVCVDKFGAEGKRSNGIRYLDFNNEKLEKAKAAYVFPDKVTILEKNVSESAHAESDRDDRVSGCPSANENSSEQENSQEPSNNSTNEGEKTKEVEEMKEQKTDEEDEIRGGDP
jgi:hypothetical protein